LYLVFLKGVAATIVDSVMVSPYLMKYSKEYKQVTTKMTQDFNEQRIKDAQLKNLVKHNNINENDNVEEGETELIEVYRWKIDKDTKQKTFQKVSVPASIFGEKREVINPIDGKI
jgi:mannitol-specific phosphotransferase system IIBC component